MRYSFALHSEAGEVEIGFAGGREMLAIIAARRDKKERAPTVMDAYSGERVTEAQIRADVRWGRTS